MVLHIFAYQWICMYDMFAYYCIFCVAYFCKYLHIWYIFSIAYFGIFVHISLGILIAYLLHTFKGIFWNYFWHILSLISVLSLISENPRSRFMLELMVLLCRFRVLKRVARSQLLRLFNDGSNNTSLLSGFFLKFRSVRILNMILCSGSLVWLFSPAWDVVNSPCQEFGFICALVVIDSTNLGATPAIARNLLQDWCLTISYLSPTQNPCLFTLLYWS